MSLRMAVFIKYKMIAVKQYNKSNNNKIGTKGVLMLVRTEVDDEMNEYKKKD